MPPQSGDLSLGVPLFYTVHIYLTRIMYVCALLKIRYPEKPRWININHCSSRKIGPFGGSQFSNPTSAFMPLSKGCTQLVDGPAIIAGHRDSMGLIWLPSGNLTWPLKMKMVIYSEFSHSKWWFIIVIYVSLPERNHLPWIPWVQDSTWDDQTHP